MNIKIEESYVGEPAGDHHAWQIVGRPIEKPNQIPSVHLHSKVPPIKPKSKLLESLQKPATLQHHSIIFSLRVTPKPSIIARRFPSPVWLLLVQRRTPSNRHRRVDIENNLPSTGREIKSNQDRCFCQRSLESVHSRLLLRFPHKPY